MGFLLLLLGSIHHNPIFWWFLSWRSMFDSPCGSPTSLLTSSRSFLLSPSFSLFPSTLKKLYFHLVVLFLSCLCLCSTYRVFKADELCNLLFSSLGIKFCTIWVSTPRYLNFACSSKGLLIANKVGAVSANLCPSSSSKGSQLYGGPCELGTLVSPL